MNELNKQMVALYAKQLRLPTFNHYEDIIRQLDSGQSYDDFLVALMRSELESRQESTRRKRIKAAHFPYMKAMDEFDCGRLEHVSEAQLRQLASCDFVASRQNIVMIGNPGTGKTHLSCRACRPLCRAQLKYMSDEAVWLGLRDTYRQFYRYSDFLSYGTGSIL